MKKAPDTSFKHALVKKTLNENGMLPKKIEELALDVVDSMDNEHYIGQAIDGATSIRVEYLHIELEEFFDTLKEMEKDRNKGFVGRGVVWLGHNNSDSKKFNDLSDYFELVRNAGNDNIKGFIGISIEHLVNRDASRLDDYFAFIKEITAAYNPKMAVNRCDYLEDYFQIIEKCTKKSATDLDIVHHAEDFVGKFLSDDYFRIIKKDQADGYKEQVGILFGNNISADLITEILEIEDEKTRETVLENTIEVARTDPSKLRDYVTWVMNSKDPANVAEFASEYLKKIKEVGR